MMSTDPASSAPPASRLSRRTFLRSTAASATAVTFGPKSAWAQAPSDQLNVALVGCGAQGATLLNAGREMLQSGSIRLAGVCDIHEYKLKLAASAIRPLTSTPYTHIDDLLAKETSLDAVLIAVPDFLHAPYTDQCLRAGKHVYCEKMMSNTIEAARTMVQAQKETNKLCQIGHQRRSNPRYLRMKKEIIGAGNPLGKSLLGVITNAAAQWNRAVVPPISVNKRIEVPQEILTRHGYANMHEFLNWRWFKKYGGGALSDLGAHQIDLFNWFLDSMPVSLVASGGRDYYNGASDGDTQRPNFELPDNITCSYEYNVHGQTVRCGYTVLTTTSSQGIFEKVMGTEASVVISEDNKNNQIYRENIATWDAQPLLDQGFLGLAPGSVHHKFWESPKPWWQEDKWLAKVGVKAGAVDARESKAAGAYELPEILTKFPHTPHLENFIDCVRQQKSQADLNCPVQEAYKTCVTVLRVYDALNEGKKIVFAPAEFTV